MLYGMWYSLKQKSESTKMANISSFIKELQDNLSNEAYQTFKTELSKYKKVSILTKFNHCGQAS